MEGDAAPGGGDGPGGAAATSDNDATWEGEAAARSDAGIAGEKAGTSTATGATHPASARLCEPAAKGEIGDADAACRGDVGACAACLGASGSEMASLACGFWPHSRSWPIQSPAPGSLECSQRRDKATMAFAVGPDCDPLSARPTSLRRRRLEWEAGDGAVAGNGCTAASPSILDKPSASTESPRGRGGLAWSKSCSEDSDDDRECAAPKFRCGARQVCLKVFCKSKLTAGDCTADFVVVACNFEFNIPRPSRLDAAIAPGLAVTTTDEPETMPAATPPSVFGAMGVVAFASTAARCTCR
mmetsp:Transcript_49061/g.137347  ORF Transcript_49061/g.137347 Transcript_49061/m.137347 type:complete len:300 (-) Transcript_49061:198-1097(-)